MSAARLAQPVAERLPERVSVRLTKRELAALNRMVTDEGKRASDLVREALEAYLTVWGYLP